jgi:hypothetical protein
VIGKKLIKLEPTDQGDIGLKLTFEDGSILEFAFSADEGTVWVDGHECTTAIDFDEVCES